MSEQNDPMQTMENWAKLYFFQSLTEFFNYLKQTDLSLLQAYALAHLFFKGPLKMSELCEHMMVSPAAGSQLIDRLEKLGMVERISEPGDRRVRKIVVLEKGKDFVQENFRFSQSWIAKIPADITLEQVTKITEVLAMLLKGSGKNIPFNEEAES
ncbi:MAG: MarR family transcriptional regulator [Anaerolineales bacterium]|nr:MarR family transcriptional regulator [Anaerolineales bacterium]